MPKNTTADFIDKLNEAMNIALADSKSKARLVELGVELSLEEKAKSADCFLAAPIPFLFVERSTYRINELFHACSAHFEVSPCRSANSCD